MTPVNGDKDETWHRQQVELAALSADGRLIRASGSGHMIQVERPDLVTGEVLDLVWKGRTAKH